MQDQHLNEGVGGVMRGIREREREIRDRQTRKRNTSYLVDEAKQEKTKTKQTRGFRTFSKLKKGWWVIGESVEQNQTR